MSTFYLDYVNGSDAASGADWANAWKTITAGPTAARITPLDIIKIAKSPDPVSSGVAATWTHKNKTVALASALTANVDMCEVIFTTKTGILTVINATPTAGGAGYTAGDVLDVTTGGTGAKVVVATVDGGGAVTALETMAHANARGGAGYTTGASKATTGGTGDGNCTVNITTIGNASASRPACGTNAGFEGNYYANLTVPANVPANTLVFYHTISSTDISAFQNISLQFASTVANVAGRFKICLCSDTAGATVVDTIPLPVTVGMRARPINIPKSGGGNLGSAIQSVAIYTDTVPNGAASTILTLDSIIATTTNGLDLTCLISKNSSSSSGTELWYAISGINGTNIYLRNVNAGGGTTVTRGYWGTTESATLYIMRPIVTAEAATETTVVQAIQEGGTLAGGYIEFQGGYNTSTGLRDGETWFDGLNMMGYGLQSAGYIKVTNISLVRYYDGLRLSGNHGFSDFAGHEIAYCANYGVSSANAQNMWSLDYYGVHHTNSGGIQTHYGFQKMRLGLCIAAGSDSAASGFTSSTASYMAQPLIYETTFGYCQTHGFSSGTAQVYPNFLNCKFIDNVNYGYNVTGVIQLPQHFYNCESSGNGSGFMSCSYTRAILEHCVISDTVEFANGYAGGYGTRLVSNFHDDGSDHLIVSDGFSAITTANDRSGGAGKKWTVTLSNATRNSRYPADILLGRFAVVADEQVTATVYCVKSHATEAAAKLILYGGSIDGTTTNVEDIKASDTNWEQLSIAFTPTVTGVVEIYMHAWYVSGANPTVSFADFDINQA